MKHRLASLRSGLIATVVALMTASTLGACNSSNRGGGGDTGGAAGGSGGGTTGTGGASGGTTGSGGADGGAPTDGPAEVAAPVEKNACGDPDKLGAATFVSQMANAAFGDRATSDNIAYLGQITQATEPEMLDIQLYKMAAPFGASFASMSIDLSTQSNFSTCGACVIYHPDYQVIELRSQTNYIAKSGTLNITAIPTGADGGAMKLTATLSNVTFEHVMIDPQGATTVATDGCTATLTSATISADVM